MNAVINTIIKRLAVIISVFAIAWCLIDPVYAEGATYEPLSSSDCVYAYISGTTNNNKRYTYLTYSGLSDGRGVILYDGSLYRLGIVSESPFIGQTVQYTREQSSCPTATAQSIAYNGYYYFSTGFEVFQNNLFLDWPIVNTNETGVDAFIKYTFGEGAIDPIEPITYGLLDDVGFSTDIAGTGNASTSNRDTISWNPVYDTNGNNIMGASVSIRAVPGHYSADSKQNLFEKVRSDFILDNTDLAVLDTINVEAGSFSITWGNVISAFSLPFGNFISWFKTDEVFLKQGWIYQIQFTKGDYTSEWQTVYTIQSESPADSLHVINSTVIDQDTINILQQINTVNNSNNTWIINETPVNPNDNYTPPSSDDEKPWWAYLLEMINNSIGITNEYINNGTDESQEVVNNIETNNNDLDVTVTEYHDIENDLVTDMNDKVTDLDIEEDLSSDASFLSSARWVTEQFNTIVSDNPIGMILKFSLVLGFVTIFLGRFR